MSGMTKRRGMVTYTEGRGDIFLLQATAPLSEMFGYATDLRSATQGRATYTMEFAKYAEAPNNIAQEIISKNQTN